MRLKNIRNESKSLDNWVEVDSKAVFDLDGFITDYTWYTDGDKHIFMFGDKDIEEPDEDYADWECDSEEEAREWFDSYDSDYYDDDDDYYYESIKNKKKSSKKDGNRIMRLKESSVDNISTLHENDNDIFVHKYSIPYRICIESDYDYEDNWYQYPPHCDYLDDFISKAVEDFNDADMSQYIPKDVTAISAQMYPTDDFKRLVIEIKTMIRLDDNQLKRLRDWIIGQMSDGWGEGFEQRELDRYSETEYEPYYEEDEDGNEVEYEDEIEINYYVYGQVWWSDDVRHNWSLDTISENQNDWEE